MRLIVFSLPEVLWRLSFHLFLKCDKKVERDIREWTKTGEKAGLRIVARRPRIKLRAGE